MIKYFLFMLILWSTPLNAQVIVKSGEHDGFTRLVMNYGKTVTWLLGRGDDGYELRVAGEMITYDLSRAFDIIGRSRLSSIAINDESGSIEFSLACPCHAEAFEFRPGIVVVDIHDGLPRKSSQFESPLPSLEKESYSPADGLNSNEESKVETSDVSIFDWKKVAEEASSRIQTDLDFAVGAGQLDLQTSQLKAGLIEEMGRGASRGLVDLSVKKILSAGIVDLSDSTIHVDSKNVIVAGDAFPGIESSASAPSDTLLATSGEACIETARMEMDSWLDTKPVASQLYSATDGIVGEFDNADPDKIEQAAKLLLAIGFGAEARQLLTSFEIKSRDVDLLTAISFIVDGLSDPTMNFKGQETCNTASALWALLGTPSQEVSGPINTDAVFQSFSALPIEARKNLGPGLVDVLIEHGDFVAAKRIHDAISRAEEGSGAKSKLIEASIDLANNEVASAAEIAEDVIANPGPEAWMALVTLVEAKAKLALPIDDDVLLAIEAASREHSGALYHARLERGLVLAYGLSGNFEEAFRALSKSPSAAIDLWRLLSEIGNDDDVINFAVPSNQSTPPEVDEETQRKIVARLAGLGMTQAATSWLSSGDSESKDLIAEAKISQGDATAALSLIGTGTSEKEVMLRARALQALGQYDAAAELYSKSGDEAAKDLANRQAQDWEAVRQASEADWKVIAEQLNASEQGQLPNVGPLTQASNLVIESEKTRSDLSSFLNAVRSVSNLNSSRAGENPPN